jgi:hypothetical protein
MYPPNKKPPSGISKTLSVSFKPSNKSSVLYGSALYKGYPQYFSGGMTTGEHVMIYFTHNPINGTYYRVENN